VENIVEYIKSIIDFIESIDNTVKLIILIVSVASFFLKRWITKRDTKNSSIDAANIEEFIKAGNKIKEAFSGALDIINDSHLTTQPIIDLWNEIPTQRVAFKEFIVHLPKNKRDTFWKAWQDYQREDRDDFIIEYTVLEPIQKETLTEKRRLIMNRIEIFHFTHPTK